MISGMREEKAHYCLPVKVTRPLSLMNRSQEQQPSFLKCYLLWKRVWKRRHRFVPPANSFQIILIYSFSVGADYRNWKCRRCLKSGGRRSSSLSQVSRIFMWICKMEIGASGCWKSQRSPLSSALKIAHFPSVEAAFISERPVICFAHERFFLDSVWPRRRLMGWCSSSDSLSLACRQVYERCNCYRWGKYSK